MAAQFFYVTDTGLMGTVTYFMEGQASTGKVLSNIFSRIAPGNTFNEICFLLAAIGLEISVYGQSEAGHCNAGSGVPIAGTNLLSYSWHWPIPVDLEDIVSVWIGNMEIVIP